ncbi:MAG TPA: hypothetical protein V6C72_12435 [Chroococcales cyanobacterium]
MTGTVLAAALSFLPVAGIMPRPSLIPLERPWQELAFCLLMVLCGAVAGFFSGPPLRSFLESLIFQPRETLIVETVRPIVPGCDEQAAALAPSKLLFPEPIEKNFSKPARLTATLKRGNPLIMPISKFCFAFLFVCSVILCQRLNLGLVSFSGAWLYLYRNVGLLCLIFAVWVTCKHLGTVSGIVKGVPLVFVSHPLYLAALIAFLGTPMIFAAWMPICALPGTFVIMKWLVAFDEKQQESGANGRADRQFPGNSPAAAEGVARALSQGAEKAGHWRIVPYLF